MIVNKIYPRLPAPSTALRAWFIHALPLPHLPAARHPQRLAYIMRRPRAVLAMRVQARRALA
jgi:hypothetical protein